MKTYRSARLRYIQFCRESGISPLPLSERSTCLFVAYLAREGLSPQSIKAYLAAIRHWQIASGLGAPPRDQWPRLHYTLRGVSRLQSKSSRRSRLPITPDILLKLAAVWAGGLVPEYDARLLWAACCVGFFGFLRAGEFTSTSLQPSPSICVSDVAVSSHTAPSVVRVHLRRAKTDPFGHGVEIFLGKTGKPLCPVAAILNYLLIRPPGDGPLFVLKDRKPLSKDAFVKEVRRALDAAGIVSSSYAGHSFRIGAATSAAAAGVPAHLIKMMGRWTSEAYLLYLRTPRETLASISSTLATCQ